jgi:hypothetical protein
MLATRRRSSVPPSAGRGPDCAWLSPVWILREGWSCGNGANYPLCMSWVGGQGLSATTGFVLVFGAILLLTDSWLRGLLTLGSLAFIGLPFAHGRDYGLRILTLVAVTLAMLICLSIFYSWSGGWIAWWVKAFIIGLIAVAAWSWIQRDAPWKLWVIPASAAVLLIWIYVVVAAPGADRGDEAYDEVVPVRMISTPKLLKRDDIFLQALYDATNGRPGVFVQLDDLWEYLQLTEYQAQVAADRLHRSDSIETDGLGIALKRRGVDAIERQHRDRKRRGPMSNTFNFQGNASGVFGSNNRVQGGSFHAGSVPVALVQAALAAAVELRSRVTPARA